MATFKDVWNYPNNPSNGYATDSANWSGDESFGIDQRIAELKGGTYLSWNGLDPVSDLSETTATLNTAIAKYAYGLENRGPDENLTMYNLWYNPIVEATTFGDHNVTVSEIRTNGDDLGRPVYKVTTSANHEMEDAYTHGNGSSSGGVGNFDVDFKSTTDASLASAVSTHLNNTSDAKIAREINGDSDSLWVYSTTIEGNIDNIAMDEATVFIRTANEVKSYKEGTDHASEMTDSDTVRFYNGSTGTLFSDATNDTGTMATLDADRYITKGTAGGGSNPLSTLTYYTDSGKTTGAALNEEYYMTITVTLDNTGSGTATTFNLNAIDISDSSSHTITAGTGSNTATDTFAELRTHIDREYASGNGINSFARAYYTNLSGGAIVTDLNNGSIDYDELEFAKPIYTGGSPDNIGISRTTWDDATIPNCHQVTIDAGQSVDIVVKFIDPARINHPDVNGAISSVGVQHEVHTSGVGIIALRGQLDRKYISAVDIVSGGNEVYQYQNSSNVTTNGARCDTKVYYIKGSSQETAHPTGETLVQGTPGSTTTGTGGPTLTVNVDGNGRMSSITTPVRSNGGGFDDDTKLLLTFRSKADEYVASATYAEDVWDTDDEWDTDAFNTSKRWPTHIAPAGARIIVNQPSSVTASQNGTKYVRSSGVIRHQLELTYPPMTYDDFREFEAVVEAARGQATPFYLQVTNLDSPGKDVLLQRTDTNKDGGLTSPYDVRLREAMAVGDKTAIVEGFPGNQSDVFLRGEYIIAELGYGDGQLVQVINDDVDSNIYGEAKIRVPYGARVANTVGTQWYKNPSHIIVTLADDEFEYNVGTDELYRFQCRFDFDEFK